MKKDIPSSVWSDPPAAQAGSELPARLTSSSDITPPRNPLLLEQPTVISKSPPTATPVISDSAYRILEGRILPGDHLGHFELIEYVGGGGMGRVFRAVDTRLARNIALKILSPNQASDPETLQRFQNEAQSAARLDHENIARVHYVGEDRGIHFIAFEFVEGVNIRGLVEQKGVLPLDEAVNYVLQTAEALAHADSRHVVHRDIKPSNVLITPEGRVKLIDMGLARLRQLDHRATDLTASGVTLGTFDYISPEQARDPRNADIRSDIYSLGCTFFFMLTGRPPFSEGTVLQKLLQHQSEQPPDVRQFRPDLPEEIQPVLQKMLAKDPQDRYCNPAALVADLTALAERLGLQLFPAVSRVWMPPPERRSAPWHRHLPWMVALAALLLIVLMVDWIGKTQGPAVSPPAPPSIESPKTSLQSPAPLTEPASRPAPSPPSPPAMTAESPSGGVESLPPTPPSGVLPPALPLGTLGNQIPDGSVTPAPAIDPFLPNVMPLSNPLQEDSYSPAENGTLSAPLQWLWEPHRGRFSWESSSPPMPLPLGESDRTAGGFLPPPVSPRLEYPPPGNAPGKRNNVLIVGNGAEGPGQFTSLQAACAAARSGDVIELRFDGRREERPLQLVNLNVTIRGGEGCRPILVFRPDDSDPVKFPRSMFTLTDGRLTLSSLAVEFQVPRDIPAESWSLLELRGGQTLRVEQCVLTVRNASQQNRAYHSDVTFFRVQPAMNAESLIEPFSPSAVPLATLELADVVARGEAVLLSIDHLQPVHLVWENGLLATTECLIRTGGGAVTPKPEVSLRVDLRHVTAEIRRGLCRLTTTPDEPYFLPVQINSLDNIFITLPGVPLLEQRGVGTLEDFRRQIVWNGDRNFYQQTDVLWRMEPLSGDRRPEALNAEAWRHYWGPSRENQPMFDQVIWKRLPAPERPVSSDSPADFALNEGAIENPAIGSASDSRNAGLIAERLLPIPPDSSSTASPPLPLGVRQAEGHEEE
jgi:serine/threonine protein kinase